MIFATPLFAIKAYIDMHKLGWRPQVYVSSVSIEPTVMQIATASTSTATTAGSTSIAFVKDPTQSRWAKDPAVKLYRQIMAKYDPDGRPTDVYNFYGMAVAYTMVDVLKKAGRNLTRDSLLQAATHLNEAEQPVPAPRDRPPHLADRLLPDGPGRVVPLPQGHLGPARDHSFPPSPSALVLYS